MRDAFRLIEPRVRPPLDPGFRHAVLANRYFREEVAAAKHVLILGRCTSGSGGGLILDGAHESIAATSLPALDGGKR